MRWLIIGIVLILIFADMHAHRECVYTIESPVGSFDTIVPYKSQADFEALSDLGMLYVEKDIFGQTEKFQASITNKQQVEFNYWKFILFLASIGIFMLAFIISQHLLYRSYEQNIN